MHNHPLTGRHGLEIVPGCRRRYVTVLAVLALLVQPACLFHKKKAAVPETVPAVPTRVVLLPFNLPAGNTELRWVSIAAPILLAKTMEGSPDLEVVPIWQGMPIAVEAAGQAREVTPEIAAYVASRLAAKWATEGQLTPAKEGIALTLDFIPAKATMIAFRFQKDARVDALGIQFQEATKQFLEYLVARPPAKAGSKLPETGSLKELADALDREYGWYSDANPGKADAVVANLIRADANLARLLFNPGLYPALGSVAPTPRPVDLKPMPPPPAEKTPPETSKPSSRQEPPPAPPPESKSDAGSTVAPPPPTASPPTEPAALGASVDVAPERPTRDADDPATQPNPQNYRISAAGRAGGEQSPQSFQPTSQPAPERTKAKQAAGGGPGYAVQVSATHDKAEAEEMAGRLENAGLAAQMERVNLKDKGTWYRVRLTGYESRSEAKRAADKLVSSGVIKQYWIP